jgi:NADH dehydrogenase [ubiquinone] 1 alpha subcomplex assembly factor 5
MSAPGPFDDRLVALRRARALARAEVVAPLAARLADEVAARAGEGAGAGAQAPRRFGCALDLGVGAGWLAPRLPADRVVALDPAAPCARAARRAGLAAVAGRLDRPPFAPASFDLVASMGALDTVNDLPAALAAARRLLRPGGRFQAALAGGEALFALRRALFEAEDAAFGGVAPRLHPMLDPAQAPALLQHAGFADPVVDVETWTLRYRALADLVRDLRAGGLAGALASRPPWRGRRFWAEVAARFAAQADGEGRVAVRVGIIHLRGEAGT